MTVVFPLSRGTLNGLPSVREKVDPLKLLQEGPKAARGLDNSQIQNVRAILINTDNLVAVVAHSPIKENAAHISSLSRADVDIRSDTDTPFTGATGGKEEKNNASTSSSSFSQTRNYGDYNRLHLWSPSYEQSLNLARTAEHLLTLGMTRDGTMYIGIQVSEDNEYEGVSWVHMRWCGNLIEDDHSAIALAALALVQWHKNTRFCQRCGGKLAVVFGGWVVECTVCKNLEYPRQDPAVIMAVRDYEDRLLLAHNTAWKTGYWSVLAGFVDAAESPERAVRREVLEEVGVHVGDMHFVGSQPWPFPRSLMLGFAAYLSQGTSTEITIDKNEIDAARFFSRRELHDAIVSGAIDIPGPTAIARVLIEDWYGKPLPLSPHILDPTQQR